MIVKPNIYKHLYLFNISPGNGGLLPHQLAQGEWQEPHPWQFRFQQILDNFKKEENLQAPRATKI